MSTTETFPKPDGDYPRSQDTCPKCGVPPAVPHKPDCPWLLWATDPEPAKKP